MNQGNIEQKQDTVFNVSPEWEHAENARITLQKQDDRKSLINVWNEGMKGKAREWTHIANLGAIDRETMWASKFKVYSSWCLIWNFIILIISPNDDILGHAIKLILSSSASGSPDMVLHATTWPACHFFFQVQDSWYHTYDVFDFCQAQVRSPKVQSPKVKTKGTWADTKITWATTPPHPPLTFKHEGVLW